ncbi:MAG: BsaWI family type II restriction enzyme [Candidatus Aenigmatarchaeota archaeon]
MSKKEYETVDERQSYVQKSGQEWENKVMDFVNQELKKLGSDLVVISGRSVKKGSALWNKLSIPVGKGETSQKIWGDIDLIVIDKQENPIAVISCKTSLHGRFSETLFYAVVLKEIVEDLKVVFATSDKGRQQKGSEWQSEWGSEEKPTKDRLLGSHYLDGVYVLNPKTKLGSMIKHLDELPKDLINWQKSMKR